MSKPPFETVGDIRAAAFRLCDHVRDTEYHAAAAEFHDRLMSSLPGHSDIPVSELRRWLTRPRWFARFFP